MSFLEKLQAVVKAEGEDCSCVINLNRLLVIFVFFIFVFVFVIVIDCAMHFMSGYPFNKSFDRWLRFN